ncbi:MAG TPA: arginyltransferase [Gammaproteobacteria bacterium]|nr:arginyltransferase [Gammaproteobacteria bacterium]
MTKSAQSVKLYATPPQPCSYLPDMLASNTFIDPAFIPSPEAYQSLIERGFRRSGAHLYKPVCNSCNACLPCRVNPTTFKPDRSQRRCWKKNSDLQVHLNPASFSDEAFSLYAKYLDSRHAEGDMANPDHESFTHFLYADWSNTWFVEFRLNQALKCVAVVDRLPNAVSAVYTFFDPDEARRSLGTLAVLWQLNFARIQGLSWVYLGYWIEASRKMQYKSRYRPLQVLENGRWHELDIGTTDALTESHHGNSSHEINSP